MSTNTKNHWWWWYPSVPLIRVPFASGFSAAQMYGLNCGAKQSCRSRRAKRSFRTKPTNLCPDQRRMRQLQNHPIDAEIRCAHSLGGSGETKFTSRLCHAVGIDLPHNTRLHELLRRLARGAAACAGQQCWVSLRSTQPTGCGLELSVIPGRVPGIHPSQTPTQAAGWIPATSAGMTVGSRNGGDASPGVRTDPSRPAPGRAAAR
jgi:hypothetical protein